MLAKDQQWRATGMSGGAGTSFSVLTPPFIPSKKPPPLPNSAEVGPHNFKDHFDKETLEYVREDVRMSTLQRKLIRESNPLVSHALACQISEVIFYSDNRAYVFRSYEVICDAAFEVIHSSKHGDKIKSETANAIGRVGFILASVNDGEFELFWKYYSKIWERFKNESEREKDFVYCIKAFHTLLSMRTAIEKAIVARLADDLQDTLEKTENSILVSPLINTLVLVSQVQPKQFEPRFQDIVDILVGWHVDVGQTPALKMHISSVLLSWHSFWIIDLEFSAGLLRQFIEDIESFTEDVEQCQDAEELTDCVERISSVVQVFNTVLSCLRSKSSRQKAVSFLPAESAGWANTILGCLLAALKKRNDEDILLAGQQSILMLAERMESLFRDHEQEIRSFFAMGIDLFRTLSYRGQAQTMEFTSKMIILVETKLQVELVEVVLHANLIQHVGLTNGQEAKSAMVKFFRDQLKSKNILILQEVYLALLAPLQSSLMNLGLEMTNHFVKVQENPSCSRKSRLVAQEQKIVLFVMECLSDLINGRGSVLSMWALEPSVFVLLTEHCGLVNQDFANKHPWIHFSFFKVLKMHCESHHQFFASSQLLASNQAKVSSMAPSANYFQTLLKLMTTMNLLNLMTESRHLLTGWMNDILQTAPAAKCQAELSQAGEFNEFLETVLATQDMTILETLATNYTAMINADDKLISRIYWIVMKKLDSSNFEERLVASKIISCIPPLAGDWIKAKPVDNNSTKPDSDSADLKLRPADFKTLSESVLKSPLSDSPSSLVTQMSDTLETLGISHETTVDEMHCIGRQLAFFCINNKLKTPLGKAQETLGAFETTMRSLANILGKTTSTSVVQIRHARNYLVVFEMLEKAMYNAWDGNNISAFFVANQKTCLDWLSRLHVMAAHVSFHLGEYAFALRQCHKALPKVNSEGQEDIVAIAAISMKNLPCGEENITGLYTWCRENMGRKFKWMKGLIDLSKKRNEDGVKQIKAYLQGTGGLCHQLLLTEMVSGHFSLCEYTSYATWLEDYKKQNESSDTMSELMHESSLQALSSFEQGSLNRDLLGAVQEETGQVKSHQGIWDLLTIAHRHLLTTVPHVPSKGEDTILELTKASVKLDELLLDNALTQSQLKRILIMKCVLGSLKGIQSCYQCDIEQLLTYRDKCHDSENLLLLKKWGDFFIRFVKQKPHLHFQLNSMNLEIAMQARKEHNYHLAHRHLEQNLGCSGQDNFVNHIGSINFNNAMMFLSTDKAHCLRQSAKLCYVLPNSETAPNHNKMIAVQVLCGIAYVGMREYENVDLIDISARSCNTLAKWLKRDPQLMDPDVVTSTQDAVTLSQILSHQPVSDTILDDYSLLVTDAATDSDMVIGRLMRLAVNSAPQMAKVWSGFANWALEIGQKVFASAENGRVALTSAEEKSVLEAIDDHLSEDQCQEVISLMSQVHLKQSQGEIEVDKSDFMKKTLSELPCVKGLSEDILERLMAAWHLIQKRLFYYHETAAKSYFKFIALSSGSAKEQRVISATLRLLQLIVKHSLELQDVLQEGLAETPSRCWRAIIPQLFSRLNHPVKVVRNRISDLLSRIAEDHPHLVIYPAIVGSMASEPQVSKIFEDNLDEDAEDADSPKMQSAHEKIVQVMASSMPESVNHVKILVSELQRISLLWDELWFGTIQQYSPEIIKRVKKMEEEAKRLDKNTSLSDDEKRDLVKDKYFIIFKPLLYVFSKVEAITKNPESPTEVWFISKYGKLVDEMMQKIREPSDFAKPREVWSLVDQLQGKIAAKLQKKSLLKLADISPVLANLKDSSIPMPGQEDRKHLFVSQIEGTLTILHTKTKPKRFSLRGNDGKKYTYLFKGLEDMHLDERIMQFLSIANTLMIKTGSGSGGYRARHYSVVPLGPRSGIIQWVEGAVPMFSMYKRWHQRRQQRHEVTKKGSERQIPQKPADQYYNKLIPHLRDHGIHNLDNRKEWPLPIMRQVMMELIEETPDDLLSLELWLSSKNSQEWHRLTTNLTRSIAVMSIIGYIIGLGDRHLDNLLVDFKSGEIIHIDYNVCFEKGAKLRIPERVPCRLTQNMVKVFGLTGVNGVFRQSCEHTLEILRGGKETLLTLLEAFVYDPLVDWTPGVELGLAGAYARHNPEADGNKMVQDRRDMQAEITFSMLSVRVAEMKGSWMANKATLTCDLSAIEDGLASWVEQHGGLQLLKDTSAKLHKSMSILKEAEAASTTTHRLYALQDRFAEYRAVETAVEASRTKIANYVEDYERLASMFQRVSQNLSSGQLAKWTTDLAAMASGMTSPSAIVGDFLKKAGQTTLLEQLDGVETGFKISVDKLRASLGIGLQLLGTYISLSSMYPQSYKSEHRVNLYLDWLKLLSENFNNETCQLIINDFTDKFVDMESDTKRMRQHHVMNLNYQLENWAQEIHFRLQNIFQRMINEGIENSRSVIDAGLLLQSDVATYIQTHKGFSVGLCLAELVRSMEKLTALDSKIDPDNFVGQTANDGEWFLLDKIIMEIGYTCQVLNFMEIFNLTESTSVNLLAVNNVLKQFKQLNGSYFAIILQEGLKNYQREDSSIEASAFNVQEIIDTAGVPLYQLILELETGNSESAIKSADQIKTLYMDFIQKCNQSTPLTPGQMIVLAFNALCDNIDGALKGIEGHDKEVEGKAMSLATFMSRLESLSEFFTLCARSKNCFKADKAGQLFPSGDDMGRPVTNYIAHYYRRHLKDHVDLILVQFINSIVHLSGGDKTIAARVHEYMESHVPIARDKVQFLTLETKAIFANLRKTEVALHLEHKVEILHASQQINQLQRNSFQWFHENDLPMEAITAVAPLRPQVMHDLKGCLAALIGTQDEITNVQAHYHELHNTVEQRLKWACGANPDLQAVFDNYSSAFSSQIEAMKASMGMSKAMTASANTVIHHESLRTTTIEALNSDSFLMALLGECQQSAQLQEAQAANQELGELEHSIFNLNPPEDLIGSEWIKQTADIVAHRVKLAQKETNDEQDKLKTLYHHLQTKVMDFKRTLTSHQKLMADVGALLRTIDKAEELEVPEVKQYLIKYREFTDLLGRTLREIADDLTEDKVRELAADVEALKEALPGVYDDLISLTNLLREENIEHFKKVTLQSAKEGSTGGDATSSNAEEKNAFALSVLRRIKMKLDGREPDVLRKASVADQVDYIIREATNVENLALLYEGWTAWI